VITIRVNGTPAPQGSKRAFVNKGTGRVNMVESSSAVKPWREAVRAETQRALGQLGHGEIPAPGTPTAIDIQFRLPRPRSAPKKVTLPAKRPDLDKLARAVLDGLVAGGALADDAQVTCLNLAKTFATDAEPAGALIVIGPDEMVRLLKEAGY